MTEKLSKTLSEATGPDEALDSLIAETLEVDLRPYSSSVTSCLDLIHEKLPKAHWHVGRAESGVGVYAFIQNGGDEFSVEATTVPLAMLKVIFKTIVSN